MKASLPGLHKVTSKGRTYYYAWRGGPRIEAKPNTPEFHIEYAEACKAHVKAKRAGKTFDTLCDEFMDSTDFTSLSAASQKAYRAYLKLAREEFGDADYEALQDPGMRGDIKEWRDKMAATPRKADYAWTCVARVLSFGKDRGRLKVNVCERGGRLYRADRNDNIWTEEALSALFAVASFEVSAVVVVALWTGQRQGDILRLPWSAYDGKRIRLRQSKGGIRVTVPVGDELADVLALVPRRGPVMLTNTHGMPWTSDGFRTSFGKACDAAGIAGVTFHDLRGTAVTRMARAGSTEAEIAAVTGHATSDVKSILDKHYLSRDVELAESAVTKRQEKEAGTSAVKLLVKRSRGSGNESPDGA